MKKCSYLAVFFGCTLLMPLAPASAQADDVVVGVNLENSPDQLTAQEQDTILENMKDAGVRVVRAGIIDNDKNLDFIQRVYAHGIKIIGLAGVRGPSGNMILSVADPDKFRAYYQPFLAKLESKGIVFAGLQLGTEINTAGWNNDLAGGTGRVLTLEDLTRDPEGQQVAKGYLQYVKLLAVLKDIRDHSQLNRQTPIISAGLAAWAPQRFVSIATTIQFLRANGANQFVDAYAVHWYPRGNVSPAVRLSDMQQVFAECGSGSSGGKPCWLTEWGLPAGDGKSCPAPSDDGRATVFSELRNDFSQVAQQGRLKGIIFYTWEGNIHDPNYSYDPYSAFLCGALTPSGRVAIAPM